MLQYLVTSKARRRLLGVLWGKEPAEGTAADLAALAGVSLASAQTELRAMRQAQLVTGRKAEGREVLSANLAHPDGDTLRALVASETRRLVPDRPSDGMVRRRLKALGAPLRGVEPAPVEDPVDAVLDGVELARRDPVVARALPLCLWRVRDALDAMHLTRRVRNPERKHALGFFLELTGELGGDRRLLGVADVLRDGRMKSLREFFQTGAPPRGGPQVRRFPLAERWGFRMNADLESYKTLFDEFVR